MICVFAWGLPRFWPKVLSPEIAKHSGTGCFIVNPPPVKPFLVVTGSVFGEPPMFLNGTKQVDNETLPTVMQGRGCKITLPPEAHAANPL